MDRLQTYHLKLLDSNEGHILRVELKRYKKENIVSMKAFLGESYGSVFESSIEMEVEEPIVKIGLRPIQGTNEIELVRFLSTWGPYYKGEKDTEEHMFLKNAKLDLLSWLLRLIPCDDTCSLITEIEVLSSDLSHVPCMEPVDDFHEDLGFDVFMGQGVPVIEFLRKRRKRFAHDPQGADITSFLCLHDLLSARKEQIQIIQTKSGEDDLSLEESNDLLKNIEPISIMVSSLNNLRKISEKGRRKRSVTTENLFMKTFSTENVDPSSENASKIFDAAVHNLIPDFPKIVESARQARIEVIRGRNIIENIRGDSSWRKDMEKNMSKAEVLIEDVLKRTSITSITEEGKIIKLHSSQKVHANSTILSNRNAQLRAVRRNMWSILSILNKGWMNRTMGIDVDSPEYIISRQEGPFRSLSEYVQTCSYSWLNPEISEAGEVLRQILFNLDLPCSILDPFESEDSVEGIAMKSIIDSRYTGDIYKIDLFENFIRPPPTRVSRREMNRRVRDIASSRLKKRDRIETKNKTPEHNFTDLTPKKKPLKEIVSGLDSVEEDRLDEVTIVLSSLFEELLYKSRILRFKSKKSDQIAKNMSSLLCVSHESLYAFTSVCDELDEHIGTGTTISVEDVKSFAEVDFFSHDYSDFQNERDILAYMYKVCNIIPPVLRSLVEIYGYHMDRDARTYISGSLFKLAEISDFMAMNGAEFFIRTYYNKDASDPKYLTGVMNSIRTSYSPVHLFSLGLIPIGSLKEDTSYSQVEDMETGIHELLTGFDESFVEHAVEDKRGKILSILRRYYPQEEEEEAFEMLLSTCSELRDHFRSLRPFQEGFSFPVVPKTMEEIVLEMALCDDYVTPVNKLYKRTRGEEEMSAEKRREALEKATIEANKEKERMMKVREDARLARLARIERERENARIEREREDARIKRDRENRNKELTLAERIRRDIQAANAKAEKDRLEAEKIKKAQEDRQRMIEAENAKKAQEDRQRMIEAENAKNVNDSKTLNALKTQSDMYETRAKMNSVLGFHRLFM